MQSKIGPPNISSSASPPVAFHFLVVFYGIGGASVPNSFDIRFQKVTGIELSITNMDSKRIGGRQVRLPNFPEYTNLTLERGYIIGNSPLRKELELTFESLEFCPRNVHVILLDTQSLPIASWLFFDAFPVKWALSDLDASQSNVLIETMELSYSRFQAISL